MKDNLFDYINSILYKSKLNEKIHSTNTEYNQYLINRWLSMYSPDVANVVNATVNVYGFVLEKHEHYEFLLNLLNRCKSKKINYIKKSKSEKEEDDIEEFSQHYEISKREVKEMIDLLKEVTN